MYFNINWVKMDPSQRSDQTSRLRTNGSPDMQSLQRSTPSITRHHSVLCPRECKLAAGPEGKDRSIVFIALAAAALSGGSRGWFRLLITLEGVGLPSPKSLGDQCAAVGVTPTEASTSA